MPWRASRNPRIQAKWRRMVAEFHASGMTTKDFAAVHSVSTHSLSRWNAWVRREEEAAAPPPEMVELLVEPAPEAPDDGGFVVELRGGHRVQLSSRFDAVAFERLAEVLVRL